MNPKTLPQPPPLWHSPAYHSRISAITQVLELREIWHCVDSGTLGEHHNMILLIPHDTTFILNSAYWQEMHLNWNDNENSSNRILLIDWSSLSQLFSLFLFSLFTLLSFPPSHSLSLSLSSFAPFFLCHCLSLCLPWVFKMACVCLSSKCPWIFSLSSVVCPAHCLTGKHTLLHTPGPSQQDSNSQSEEKGIIPWILSLV